ncbi:MAG: YihY/virulence factor BrkB family protein [Candidatus Omnitrophota bacterium]
MAGWIRSTGDFLTRDIWRIRAKKLKGPKSFFLRQLRILVLAFRSFAEDKCQLRASALTYYTLLSIVPLVAMAFGVAKGFGFETMLEKQLYARLPGQEEVVNRIVVFAHSWLENTRGGVIAGIGVAVLFWTVIKVLGNIEKSFNDIWGVKRSRSFGRKFSDYLSVMILGPLLFIMSSSVTVLITTQVKLVVENVAILGWFAPVILLSLNLLPFIMIWVLFTFIYIFMPNTRVLFKAGLLGGVVAGTIYQFVQWIYITFQVGVSKFGAIYGSFAALPLFLFWLQISWLIVLFGAEISFAEQNVDTYEFEPDCLNASQRFKRLAALRIAHLSVKNFIKAKTPRTAAQIAYELEMPIRLVRDLLFELTEAGILVEVRLPNAKEVSFQPARDVDGLTIQHICRLLDGHGLDSLPQVRTDDVYNKLKESLDAFDQQLAKAPANMSLKKI